MKTSGRFTGPEQSQTLPRKTKHCVHNDNLNCCYCDLLTKANVPEKIMPKLLWGFYQDILKKSYSGHGCDRCGGIDEGYMLHDSMWNAAKINDEEYLCLACIEKIRVTSLKLKHFSMAPINFGAFGFDCRQYVKQKR